MSANVLIATAIFAFSVVACIAYLCWYGWREEAYDFTAEEKPRPLPGALGVAMEARIAETWPPLDANEPIYNAVKRQHEVRFMAEAIEELRGLGVDLGEDE